MSAEWRPRLPQHLLFAGFQYLHLTLGYYIEAWIYLNGVSRRRFEKGNVIKSSSRYPGFAPTNLPAPFLLLQLSRKILCNCLEDLERLRPLNQMFCNNQVQLLQGTLGIFEGLWKGKLRFGGAWRTIKGRQGRCGCGCWGRSCLFCQKSAITILLPPHISKPFSWNSSTLFLNSLVSGFYSTWRTSITPIRHQRFPIRNWIMRHSSSWTRDLPTSLSAYRYSPRLSRILSFAVLNFNQLTFSRFLFRH